MIFFKYRNVQQIQFTRFRQWIASCRGRLSSAAAQWTRDRNSAFCIPHSELKKSRIWDPFRKKVYALKWILFRK